MKKISYIAALGMGLSCSASALQVKQDQGVLEVKYENIDKPYEYQIVLPQGCEGTKVNTSEMEGVLSFKHQGSCGSGARITLTLKEGTPIQAELEAGSFKLVNFRDYQSRLGSVELKSEVGTVNVPPLMDFEKSEESYIGRSYHRPEQSKGPSVRAKVRYGVIEVTL